MDSKENKTAGDKFADLLGKDTVEEKPVGDSEIERFKRELLRAKNGSAHTESRTPRINFNAFKESYDGVKPSLMKEEFLGKEPELMSESDLDSLISKKRPFVKTPIENKDTDTKIERQKKPDDDDRVSTGIYGLDTVIGGGLRENTITLLLGPPGTGKRTMSFQFALKGLENNENVIFISFENQPEQIIRSFRLLGGEVVEKALNKRLFFVHVNDRDFRKFATSELKKIADSLKNSSRATRVVINPLTPLLWAVNEKSRQRRIISKIFDTLRVLGPVIATVDEYDTAKTETQDDLIVPLYLADGIIHLSYQRVGNVFNRTIEILKMRGVRHGEEIYPYIFTNGFGVIVKTSPLLSVEMDSRYAELFSAAIKTAESKNLALLVGRLEEMMSSWNYNFSPAEALQIIFRSYGIELDFGE